MKINWKQKLTSRKFWAAIVGFITSILVVLHVDALTTEQIIGVITAASVLVAYIVGEGLVDSARVDANIIANNFDNAEEKKTLES